jgi:hypothetical protein
VAVVGLTFRAVVWDKGDQGGQQKNRFLQALNYLYVPDGCHIISTMKFYC